MPARTADRPSPRERLLDAADELFYEEGISSVGINRVIDRAGVAKASLYDVFGSKDELVGAYLTRRHEARRQRLSARLATYATPRERLLGVFDVLGDLFAEPGFRGCAFLNASAEARAGTTVAEISGESRGWVRALFGELARDAGVADPALLGRQLVLLYDGATVAAQMDGDPGVAQAARAAAEVLLDAAPRAEAV